MRNTLGQKSPEKHQNFSEFISAHQVCSEHMRYVLSKWKVGEKKD